MWKKRSSPPTAANSKKRTGTNRPIILSSKSIAYSIATKEFEFALAVLPCPKLIRPFLQPKRRFSRCNNIEQDLEPLPGKLSDHALEGFPGDHKEAAHRVGHLYAGEHLRRSGSDTANQFAFL